MAEKQTLSLVHTLIEDPLEDNNSDDSITEPPPAKRVLRSQIDAFDINKCAICQQDKTMLTKNKGARSREPLSLNMTATSSASLLKAAQIRDDRRLLLQILLRSICASRHLQRTFQLNSVELC